MFYSAGYSSGSHDQRAQIERKHYAAATPNRVNQECSGLKGASQLECVTKIVDAQRESERGESDLAAQWQAADWVMWASILAGAQLIATFAGLYFVKRTLDATLVAVEDTGKATSAMLVANEIAQRSMVEQLRPWLVATISDGWLFPGEENLEGSAISAIVTIQNVGQTVARQITVFAMSRADAENFSTEFRIATPYQANQYSKIQDLFRDEESEAFQLTSVGDPKAGYLITITYRTVFDTESDPLRVTEMFYRANVGGAYPGGHELQRAVEFVRAANAGAGVR